MEGWILLHKKLLEWEWYKDINTKIVFIHCLLKANYIDKEWQGKIIKRGQFFTSLENLSKDLSLSVKQARTSLKKLKKTKELGIQGASNGTMITVLKYDSYQDLSLIKGRTKGQAKGKQRASKGATTKEIIKETKEVKEIYIPEFEEFKIYALLNKKNINTEALKLKYESWKISGWKDGNGTQIKNWKSKLLNTLPYIKENFDPKTTKNKIHDQDTNFDWPT